MSVLDSYSLMEQRIHVHVISNVIYTACVVITRNDAAVMASGMRSG